MALEVTFSLSTGILKTVKDLGVRPGDSEGAASFVEIVATEGLKFNESKRKGAIGGAEGQSN